MFFAILHMPTSFSHRLVGLVIIVLVTSQPVLAVYQPYPEEDEVFEAAYCIDQGVANKIGEIWGRTGRGSINHPECFRATLTHDQLGLLEERAQESGGEGKVHSVPFLDVSTGVRYFLWPFLLWDGEFFTRK